MQIKRFEAKNMTAALRMVKDELGPDAVILSARSRRKGKGFFGSMKYAGVEVSAAIDNQGLLMQSAGSRGEKNSFPNRRKGRFSQANHVWEKENIPPAVYPAQSRTYRQMHNPRKQGVSSDSQKAFSSLYQQLLDQEVDRSIASELIEEIKRIPASQELLGKRDIRFHLSSLLEEMGVVVDTTTFVKGSPRIAAFIGPTGVGKTTTIAKLAALQATRHRKRLGLISLDNYGISAVEQLKAYAQIIGIPFEIAVNVAELKKALKKFKDKELILIDTPGISPGNKDEIQEIKTYFAKVTDLQIHLVLSATTKDKDLIAVTEAFKEIGVHRLLFTKIDESAIFGNIINILIRMNIPLSFLCFGRKVPKDIQAGSIQKLVDLLFQSKTAGGQQPLVSSRPTISKSAANYNHTTNRVHFVANRNSDVYHRPDCKWSKKIKPKNSIEFFSTQEAEAQNYLACRSCNPDRFQSSNQANLTTERMEISNYR
jgi:flagellar biosynthesis protein FlhF